MNKLLLAIILSLTSISASAEWIKIAVSDDNTTTMYIDSPIPPKNNATVSVWEMVDYTTSVKSPNGNPAMSTITHAVYDCSSTKFKWVQLIMYTGRRGEGFEVINTNWPIDNNDWIMPPYNSLSEIAIRNVCKIQ